VDILPTISHLMGLQMGGFDGIVLSDALSTPVDGDVVVRLQNAKRL
jgi:hypothetical protein